jgi:hypothetical protein
MSQVATIELLHRLWAAAAVVVCECVDAICTSAGIICVV